MVQVRAVSSRPARHLSNRRHRGRRNPGSRCHGSHRKCHRLVRCPVIAASVSRAVTATSISASGASGRCMSVHGMSAYCLSAAATVAGVVGSERSYRDRQTTERGSGSDSNYCFVKHDFLLLGSSRQCPVASNSCCHVDTFACQTTTRFNLFEWARPTILHTHRSPAGLVVPPGSNGLTGIFTAEQCRAKAIAHAKLSEIANGAR